MAPLTSETVPVYSYMLLGPYVSVEHTRIDLHMSIQALPESIFLGVFCQGKLPTTQPPTSLQCAPEAYKRRFQTAPTTKSFMATNNSSLIITHLLLVAVLAPSRPRYCRPEPLQRRGGERVEWRGGTRGGVKGHEQSWVVLRCPAPTAEASGKRGG